MYCSSSCKSPFVHDLIIILTNGYNTNRFELTVTESIINVILESVGR